MAEKEEETKAAPAPDVEEQIATTEHAVTIGGEEIRYTATAGTLVLKEEAEKDGKAEGEKARATLFYVAYARQGVSEPASRPLTFSFNGGPGSSSVWLHLGVLGPRRVQMADDLGNLPRPPFRLVENDYSLLDRTDLVFIDPVTTGFSRPLPGEEAKQFHGFEKDIHSVGDFIRLYTTRAGRWGSPKFLIGESYGTTRAAGLSGYLQERHGMYLNGIMLVSSVLDFQTLLFQPGNDLPYILFLPTYAATAHYHRQLPEALQGLPLAELLDEVRAFAVGDYASALLQGQALPAEAAEQIARRVASYTGTSVDFVQRHNLRVPIFRFTKELLRAQGLTVGRLDSRFTGADRDRGGEHFEFDPSYAVIQGPYTATFNDYVRRDLNFEIDLPYEILTDRVRPWNYETFQNAYVYVAETLRKAMNINPFLKVFVANGYYDLATPFLATEYTFDHLMLPPQRRDDVTMTYYEAGHMMYVQQPSLGMLKEDLAAFVESAS
jgi:carboxypeptidase C (cathepsin A)